jgi:hypothetical protein
MGISVWGLDQAGTLQTMPYAGSGWELQGKFRHASRTST